MKHIPLIALLFIAPAAGTALAGDAPPIPSPVPPPAREHALPRPPAPLPVHALHARDLRGLPPLRAEVSRLNNQIRTRRAIEEQRERR